MRRVAGCSPLSSRRPSASRAEQRGGAGSHPAAGRGQRCGEGAGGVAAHCPLPPGPPKRFPVATVDAILKAVLEGCLRELRYEPGLCREMAATVSEVIKARVKDLVLPRYKIVVVTHIGQLNGQGMQIGSRCLWDPTTDTFSSYVFKNTSLFALANVYAVYFE
ncbi:tctex1 domain-containing protein 1 [Phasianus colchicus]|uniref:Tctex1 domain containing 1 n=1 Tax=Phasianus colchicus TaxID=9054 RepID=A0A669PDP0_PHACC|nr:tctex1 domain-containing protein 1 [Phasianus colchicus]